MPTTLPRIQITEGPVVRRALEIATARWPNAPKSEQLTNLIAEKVAEVEAAQRAADEARAAKLARRRAAVVEFAGIFGSDVYPPNYLADLRAENRE